MIIHSKIFLYRFWIRIREKSCMFRVILFEQYILVYICNSEEHVSNKYCTCCACLIFVVGFHLSVQATILQICVFSFSFFCRERCSERWGFSWRGWMYKNHKIIHKCMYVCISNPRENTGSGSDCQEQLDPETDTDPTEQNLSLTSLIQKTK